MKYLLEHCKPNPTFAYAESFKYIIPPEVDEIVSKGGGSTIDVGKWLARALKLKHTVIPTTAGTGSEVTKYCVLTVNGQKTTYTDDAFIPNSYVLDPKNVETLPKLHTISSGLDALSQSFESLWSRNATVDSNHFASSSIHLILSNLEKCVAEPNNLRARMDMMIGANLSGRAINITRTNVCHAISYPLTDWYGVPHGIACALTLPYFTKKIMGIELETVLKNIFIPQYKIDKRQIAKFAIKSEKLKDCPIVVTEDDIIKALDETSS